MLIRFKILIKLQLYGKQKNVFLNTKNRDFEFAIPIITKFVRTENYS